MSQIKPEFNELFDQVLQYPDIEYQERLNYLTGIDENKEVLKKILGSLINPNGLEKWAKKYHKNNSQIINYVLRRPPLVILAGDVGSGKSELASTIGDAVARQENLTIKLFPLSLTTRGEGQVGQMTKLITTAFEYTLDEGRKLKKENDASKGGVILLVDEADALGQSRENAHMHHEDVAGVNAFIRGIDQLGNGKYPAAVILCTNRLNALDPAIQRRAAEILSFSRPDYDAREKVLKQPLGELGFSEQDIVQVVEVTGDDDNKHGFTFSDLVQRFLPSIILDAYPDRPVKVERAIEIAKSIEPTKPFEDGQK